MSTAITPSGKKDEPPSNAATPSSSAPYSEHPQRARITALTKLYHNTPGEDTTGPEPISFTRWLNNDDIGFGRTIKVTEEWQPIDTVWLKDKGCAYITLVNDTKRNPGKRPTPEQLKEHESRVLEIGIEATAGMVVKIVVPILYLLPEEGTGFSPLAIENLRVRCRNGTARLTYFAVPE